MKEYLIPVYWEVGATVKVLANSLEEAIEEIDSPEFALPTDNDYVDGSFEIDLELARSINNDHKNII